MPELPEVETVRRGLEPLLTSRVVLRADVRRPDLRRLMPPNLAERLTGARVLGLRRRSKYLLADLAGGDTMLLHLGMSGRILVSGAPIGAFHHDLATPGKHDHLVLDLEGGARVAFNDARRFGSIDLCPTAGVEAHPLLSGLGPEPLGNGFDGPSLAARLAGRATPLKAALLDQRLVAGLGNIYVCEALWRAGLSPLRLARDVAPVEAEALAAAIRAVLIEAIEAGGSSLRDHRRPDGELGYFQHAFAVYGREDEACRTPGCAGVVARTVQAGRSSFHCPSCQRAPGPRG